MTEIRGSRNERESEAARAMAPEIRRDLEALAARSERGLPTLDDTRRAVAGERLEPRPEGGFMTGFGWMKARPGVAALAVAGAIAVALLAVPIPYEKTTSHRVSLALAGDAISPEAVKQIAGEFKKALGVESVQIAAEAKNAAVEYTLRVSVPGNTGGAAAAISTAFARSLLNRGYVAEASVEPVRERVSGSVYAMVADHVIRVEVQGKSAAEIEAEIAAQLAAAGVPDAQVSVEVKGDNRMKVLVRAEHEGPGECAPGMPPEIVLTVNGEEPAGTRDAAEIRMMRRIGDAGEEMVIEYARGGVAATATVANPASLSDQDLAAEVLRQLVAQGVTGISVSFENGCISIEDTSTLGGVQGTAETKQSWGQVKKELGTPEKP